MRAHPTRRGLLFGGAAAAGSVAVATATGCGSGGRAATADAAVVAFTGEHQAGITTPAQDRLHFVAQFDLLPLTAKDAGGEPIIDLKAHVRLAAPEENGGSVLLRRGYSFVDGSDGLGHLDAGLFFLA